MKTCTTADLATAHTQGATVVDVREPGEYVQGHVPGAMLIPLSQLSSRLGEIPRSGPVYVICASGNRSKVGASVLEAAGLDATSVDGGTKGWIADGRDYVTGPSAN